MIFLLLNVGGSEEDVQKSCRGEETKEKKDAEDKRHKEEKEDTEILTKIKKMLTDATVLHLIFLFLF